MPWTITDSGSCRDGSAAFTEADTGACRDATSSGDLYLVDDIVDILLDDGFYASPSGMASLGSGSCRG